MAKSLQAQRYKHLPTLLRRMREEAGLTQRDLGKLLRMSHTMVHSSETAERRVDVAEFVDWASACGREPKAAFAEFLAGQKQASP
jgi:transcriptional regulator with XRE-family HTH domain